ncbi:MAG TPA: hypothetical protein ENJ79_01470 [Gammaproteobacteria bacterium]|nr:hypothetical protein [Gammaproteobacteria bacterium]
MLMQIENDMLRYLILPVIGMIGALILFAVFFIYALSINGGRIKFRPFRIEYTMPTERLQKIHIINMKRRMWLRRLWKKEDLPAEPDEISIRNYIMEKSRFAIKSLIIGSVFTLIITLAMWGYYIWSNWEQMTQW